tara:strand:- start:11 stop:238 length:228 start_codon:yes stop_codon:yes gene_type:complete
MTVKQKDEIIDILENLPYWDTCPQDYKDRIPELLKALSKVNNGVLDDVIKCDNCGEEILYDKEYKSSFCAKCYMR